MVLKIGTRGSKLALAQSQWVKEKLEARNLDLVVELVTIKTTGDKILDSPLSKIGGKALFVKEIEEALLKKAVDLAIHSMKDIPAELPEGLALSAFPEREDPRDAFVSIEFQTLEDLRQGAKVGTSSLRRAAQLLAMRPDLKLVPLRGNVNTRLRKLEEGEVQAIILATAGLRRLGLESRITQVIPSEQVLPAIGQGALGLEVRSDDEKTINLLEFLNHEETAVTVRAERAFLKELEGGCQVPMAAFCRLNHSQLHLEGMVAELDGSKIIRNKVTGEKAKAEQIGVTLARKLIDAGANKILAHINGKSQNSGAIS
ncbi:MAG: hydroxymethylbilane synthase [Desulfobacteraceae bacterium]|nr:MAG: hydroxymethylbilane synthase [Desulfobacteraceae bacterium]